MENGLTSGRRAWKPLLALFMTCSFGFSGMPAQAGDFSLLLNGKAIHLDTKSGVRYNEKNWGLGFQYDMPRGGEKWVPFVTASGFKDSNDNMSWYAGGGYLYRQPFKWGDTAMYFDAGAVVFLMKRKGFKDGDVFPGILPAFSLGTSRVALNMSYIPKVDPKMVPILFFQLKITLGDIQK